jgi:hypothetical protein
LKNLNANSTIRLNTPQLAGPALHNSIDTFKCQQHHQTQQHHSLQAQPCTTAFINLNANSTTKLNSTTA